MSKLKIGVLCAVVAGFSLTGGGLIAHQSLGSKPTQPRAEDDEKDKAASSAKRPVPKPKTDQELIQGTWKIISVEDGGRKPPEEQLKNAKMLITDRIMTAHVTISAQEEKKELGAYRLDSAQNPKHIDVTDSKLNHTMKGIYNLKGNDLQIVFDETNKARPTKFASELNSPNDLYFVLKRVSQSPAAQAAENLLQNSGIEEGDKAPAHWSQGAEIDGVEYIWDKQNGQKGKASLCLHKTAKRYFPIAQWHQIVERKGDRPAIQVSAQVKAEGVTKATIDVIFLDANDKWIAHQWASYIGAKKDGDPPATHDWKEYSGRVDIPEGTKKITIALQIYGPGKVWFDEVQAVEAPAKAEAPAAERNVAAKGEGRIFELLREKRDTAAKMLDMQQQLRLLGRGPRLEEAQFASQRLLEAELDLAEKPSGRIAALERHLKLLKDLEESAKALHDMGRSDSDYPVIKLQRVDAELALEKEKGSSK